MENVGEIVTYLNVEGVQVANGWLHFSGREGDEEAQDHHLNLDRVQRYKLFKGTLTVYFLLEKEEEEDELPEMKEFLDGDDEDENENI